MIRVNIPGFSSTDSGGPRWGDATIIDDGTNYVVIDGYCSTGKRKLIARLKHIKCKSPYLYISHAHGDHDEGIMAILEDSYFTPKGLGCYDPATLSNGFGNSEVKSDANYLSKVIAKAKAKGVPVKILKHGDHITHGDIDFYVYRVQPKYQSGDSHGWAFINDGSLAFWFPSIKYWTSGDGPERIYDMCKAVGAKPVWFKIPHHGNNCPKSQAEGMKSLGARYCWDNDYSTTITDFLSYGRRRCIEAGIKYINIHGDINFIACKGVVAIYKGGNVYKYKCDYKGKTTLRTVQPAAVEGVLNGKYGNGEARTTALIDAGYYPASVQSKINIICELATVINGGTKYTPEAVAKVIGAKYINALNLLLDKGKQIEAVEDPEQTAEKKTTKTTEKAEAPASNVPDLRDMSELFGVDVSYAQGKIDWDKAAKEIDFAILQCGYGQDQAGQDDKQFARNASECERLGIPYGIYLYSYAGSTTRASGEAEHALRLAKGRQLSLPIYDDIEEQSIAGSAIGNISAFGLKVESAGYWCGLYTGEYYYNRNLSGTNRFTKWIAKYGTNNGKPQSKPNVDNVAIWQYSSKGRVSGISGNVDVNIMYGDSVLKGVTGKDYIQAARDVWAGKYGNDAERTAKLKAEGYDPRIVQHFVNRLVK